MLPQGARRSSATSGKIKTLLQIRGFCDLGAYRAGTRYCPRESIMATLMIC